MKKKYKIKSDNIVKLEIYLNAQSK
jgi:hypothetical protein